MEIEIKNALKQMHPAKAPGPNDMPPLFFQHFFWHITQSSFVDTCLGILNNGGYASSLNHTFIVLIPKVKSLESPKDFCPINLCNIVCRVITKVIVNRLKVVFQFIISPNQSAFITNRLIIGNAMVAFEIFHFLKKKKKGKQSFVALKLDMSKAYDRVEWLFLELCVENWVLVVDGSS